MSIDPTVTRRALLAAGAAGAGTVVIAACSSGGGGSSKSQAASTGAGSSDSGNSGATLTTLDKIPVGQAVAVQLPGGKPGIVARPTATTAAAFSAICTHMGCTVKPNGTKLDCPCHGSVYEATTGKVLRGPAPSPLPAVTVKVAGGKVVTG
jgi:Rieske Fe-S protein